MTARFNISQVLNPVLGSFLAVSLLTPAHAILTSYTNPGHGVWGVGLNWSNGVPNDLGDIAFVGSSVPSQNSRVSLNDNIALNGLLITDGMHVDTNGYSLRVSGAIPAAGMRIIGSNMVDGTPRHSALVVRPIEAQGNVVTTVPFKDASLEEGGQIILEGGGIWSTGSLEVDENSGIFGSGTIVFNSHDHFNNNGTIAAEAGGEIVIHSFHEDFHLNLDGSERTGSLSAAAPGSRLTISHPDSALIYDGDLAIGRGAEVVFQHDLLYGVGGPGSINMNSSALQTAALRVGEGYKVVVGSGSDFNTSGKCLVDGRFNFVGAETTLNVGAVNLGRLRITGDSRFLGGTVNAAGHLFLEGGVSESVNTTYRLQGGEIEAPAGTMIDLAGPDPDDHLSGHGRWSAGVNNETRIQASGGLLTVDTTNSPADWDGSTGEGRLDARNGDLHLIQPFGLVNFGSQVVVGNGHTLTLDTPDWNFSTQSRIVLGGDDDQGGTIAATSPLEIRGKVTVSKPSRFTAPTTFHATTQVALEESELLLSGGQFDLREGATVQGGGTLKVAHGSTLNFSVFNGLATGLSNEGSLTLNGNAVGALIINAPFAPAGDTGVGRVVFDLKSRPGDADFDRIIVNEAVTLNGGVLRVNFDVPNAQVGDVWKIISANSISGTFENYEFNGVPEELALQALVATDGVYLKAVHQSQGYLEWANQEGLLLADLAMNADPDGDQIDNLAEMYYGGDPLQADQGLQPTVGMTTVDGERYLTITVFQSVQVLNNSDVAMQIQQSHGLENWVPANPVLMSTVYDPGHCRNILTFRSATPVTAQPRQFLRAAFFKL